MLSLLETLFHIRNAGDYADFLHSVPDLIKYYSRLGWGQCEVFQVPFPGTLQSSLNILSTINEEFYLEYQDGRHYNYDCHHIAALKIGRALSRSSCAQICGDNERTARFEALFARHGLTQGIVVPLFDFPVRRLVFIALGEGAAPSPLELAQAELVAREFILTYFHVNPQARFRTDSLTNQERRVLECAARGNSSERIAELLEISVNTVNVHITNCQRKLRTGNRVETVAKALHFREIQFDLG